MSGITNILLSESTSDTGVDASGCLLYTSPSPRDS